MQDEIPDEIVGYYNSGKYNHKHVCLVFCMQVDRIGVFTDSVCTPYTQDEGTFGEVVKECSSNVVIVCITDFPKWPQTAHS